MGGKGWVVGDSNDGRDPGVPEVAQTLCHSGFGFRSPTCFFGTRVKRYGRRPALWSPTSVDRQRESRPCVVRELLTNDLFFFFTYASVAPWVDEVPDEHHRLQEVEGEPGKALDDLLDEGGPSPDPAALPVPVVHMAPPVRTPRLSRSPGPVTGRASTRPSVPRGEVV